MTSARVSTFALSVIAVVSLALPAPAPASCTTYQYQWRFRYVDPVWHIDRYACDMMTVKCKYDGNDEYIGGTGAPFCWDADWGCKDNCARIAENNPECPDECRAETCSDGEDQNGNDRIDEGCAPKPPAGEGDDRCDQNAGDDSIVLWSRSASTEPFADFRSEGASGPLELIRSYSSADTSHRGGPSGLFGVGWRHNWESWLTCGPTTCVAVVPGGPSYRFMLAGATDQGDEVWASANPEFHHAVLLRGASTAVVYLPDGRALHFDAAAGSRAPLVAADDPRGNRTRLSFGTGDGVLLRIVDPDGNSLELLGAQGLASQLRYNGVLVASYGHAGGRLASVLDGDGHAMRSYVYGEPDARLVAVQDEAANPITEFRYDADAQAIGTWDARSTVTVTYPVLGTVGDYWVSEEFGAGQTMTSKRTFDARGKVTAVAGSCSCGPEKVTNDTTLGTDRCTARARGDGKVLVTYERRDSLLRVTEVITYASTMTLAAACKAGNAPPSSLPADSAEERRTYGLTRQVATWADGTPVLLHLDAVSSRTYRGAMGGDVVEMQDYSPAAAADDPAGYSCVPSGSTIPLGGVPCRSKVTGRTRDATGAAVQETHSTFFSYDARGRLLRRIGPVRGNPSPGEVAPREDRIYWSDGDPLARAGRLREVRAFAGQGVEPLVTAYDYGTFGISLITAPNGSETSIQRDARGRPTSIATPAGAAARRYRDEARDYDLTLLPGGGAVRTLYDGRGRASAIERLDSDPETNSQAEVKAREAYGYDAAGNRVHLERQDASGEVVYVDDREYDGRRRPVRQYHPEYPLERGADSPTPMKAFEYDGTGFLQRLTDEEARETRYAPDGMGRITTVTRAQGAAAASVAQYAYAPGTRDALASVTDANGNTTTYEHDDFGRLVRLVSGSTGTVSFSYDARGNLLAREDGRACAVYAYDGLDRVTALDAWTKDAAAPRGCASSAGATTPPITYRYFYDELVSSRGRLSHVEESAAGAEGPTRAVAFVYDGVGQLMSVTESQTFPGADGATVSATTSFAYTADGALAGITYPAVRAGVRLPEGRVLQRREARPR